MCWNLETDFCSKSYLQTNSVLSSHVSGEEFSTVKSVLSGHSKKRPKSSFQDQLSLNAGQKYCRMLQKSILQYF